MKHLLGSIETEDYIPVVMFDDVTPDYFAKKVAKMHQKLSTIVQHANFCFSLQVISFLLVAYGGLTFQWY